MDRFFEFEKAKLFDTWKRSRNNRFSNKKIEEFHNCFKQFYDKIKHEDVTTLSEDKKKCLKNAIDYFQLRVNCLSNNTGLMLHMSLLKVLNARLGIGSQI